MRTQTRCLYGSLPPWIRLWKRVPTQTHWTFLTLWQWCYVLATVGFRFLPDFEGVYDRKEQVSAEDTLPVFLKKKKLSCDFLTNICDFTLNILLLIWIDFLWSKFLKWTLTWVAIIRKVGKESCFFFFLINCWIMLPYKLRFK